MEAKWKVIYSDEIREWVMGLPPADARIARKMFDLLETFGIRLRMPHSKPLGQGLFELRFDIERGTVAQRVTYFFDPRRSAIVLTTFRKTKRSEAAEIARARAVKAEYERQRYEEGGGHD